MDLTDFEAKESAAFTLDEILAEYGGDRKEPEAAPEAHAETAKRIVLESMDDAMYAGLFGSRGADGTEGLPPRATHAQDDEDADVKIYGAPVDEDGDVKIYTAKDMIAEAERRAERLNLPTPEPEPEPEPEEAPDVFSEQYPEDDGTRYASQDSEKQPKPEKRKHASGLGQALAAPVLSFIAAITARIKSRPEGTPLPPEDEEELGPEMPAEDAALYYEGHAGSLKRRLIISAAVSVILCWLSFGLPAFGALGSSFRVRSTVCLILELTVVLCGLDVFTSGIMSLVRGRPGMWSLLSVSCVASALDAVVCAFAGTGDWGIPFCAVSAVSVTAALWGAFLSSGSFAESCRAVAFTKEPYAVTSERIEGEKGATLLKSRRDMTGFIRRCEEPDAMEYAMTAAAPLLLALSLLLAAVATLITKNWTGFFRVFAAMTAACAPVTAYFACPLPLNILSNRLFRSGSAVAGWQGVSDIGRSKRLVVTDNDIFPASNIAISSIRVLATSDPQKVISYAGTVICASGCGLTPVFAELMRRNDAALQRLEDFSCGESGGLHALVNGERVMCGSVGFMNLMGVRVPAERAPENAVYLAVRGELCGIFEIKYSARLTVQEALNGILRTRRQPVFAIRDFLVTPGMIRRKFRLPTQSFIFPSYAKRYEISAAQPDLNSALAALISREGLGSLVEIAEYGRRAYIAATLTCAVSFVCTAVGMALCFILTVTGAGVSVGSLLGFTLLLSVPCLAVSLALAK